MQISLLSLYGLRYGFHFLSRPPKGVFRRATEKKLLNARHDETRTLAKAAPSGRLRSLDPSIPQSLRGKKG